MNGYINTLPIISILIPFAAVFVVVILGLSKKYANLQKIIVLSGVSMTLISILLMFKTTVVEGKIITYWIGSWVPENETTIGIGLQVDAFSLFISLIMVIIVLISCIYSAKYIEKHINSQKYYSLLLILLGSMLGFIFTGDLINMYIMLELISLSTIALSTFRDRVYKSADEVFKYIVVSSLGSTLILLGTILIYAQTRTLNIAQIAAMIYGNYTSVTILALALMVTGYSVKAFLVPCHTWTLDVQEHAASFVSMLLCGINKIAIYAIVRVLYMLFFTIGIPKVEIAMVLWGTLTMVLGALMAIIQKDFKRLIACSAISQIGYIVIAFGLGLSKNADSAVIGSTGGIYHILNQATFNLLLFLCAGAVFYVARTTDMTKLGGLSKNMPYTTVMFIVGLLSVSGIPPFNGFISKWFIYFTAYKEGYIIVTIISLITSIITLLYMIKVLQMVFLGEPSEKLEYTRELPITFKIPMGILACLCLIEGLFPKVILKYLVNPVVYSLYNVKGYVGSVFSKEYAEKVFKEIGEIPNISCKLLQCWNPEGWLLLFAIVLIGIIAVVISSLKFSERNIARILEDDKNEFSVFSGGEKEQSFHVGVQDLFWGFSYNFKKCFKFLHEFNNETVNDCIIWIISSVAVVSIYLLAVL